VPALSLLLGSAREAVFTITYAVVAFSIFVRGFTINRVLAMGSGTQQKNRRA